MNPFNLTFLKELVIGTLIVSLCYYSYVIGYKHHTLEVELEHDSVVAMCKDTATHEAWVAKKEGEFRCFMEHREFPHRAKGSNVSP